MTQTTIEGAGAQKRELSQFFTPADLAERIVDWALAPHNDVSPLDVLEPSAGRGALALPLAKRGNIVVCVELDPENAALLGKNGFAIVCADFLRTELRRFDLAVMNPPFENGQAEQHIMHALKFCDRVVAHVPLTTLEGKARRESLWSHVRLERLAVCASRPKYGAKGGATAMCTIDVTAWQKPQTPIWDNVTVEVWP